MGKDRFRYFRTEKLLPFKFNPNSVLSLSLSKPANAETGYQLVQGMYQLTKMQPTREQNFITKFSPLKETAFENIVYGVYYSTKAKVCMARQVQQIPPAYDTMFETQTCPNLHRYITGVLQDNDAIEKMLMEEFGPEEIQRTREELEGRFGRRPASVQEHLDMLSIMISEEFERGSRRSND